MKKVLGYLYFKPLALLFSSSLVCALMLAIRIYISGEITYFFLAWNLFLAWLPVIFALYAAQAKNTMSAFAAFAAWLLFLPNSHYILTDLFHLQPKAGVPLWYDLLLLLFTSWTGAMLGFLSFLEIHTLLKKHFSALFSWLLISGVALLESFGIYLGRFERFNSWDVLADPFSLLYAIAEIVLNPLHNRPVYYFIFGFAVFIFISYSFLYTVIQPKPGERSIH